MYQRLWKVLEDSGLQEEFDAEDKSVSIYSFRHQYAAWRLKYGNVPIHLLAKQMGTSVSKIESTYGHIMVVEEADKITKGHEILRKSEYIIDLPEVLEDIPMDKIFKARDRRKRNKEDDERWTITPSHYYLTAALHFWNGSKMLNNTSNGTTPTRTT